MNRENEFWTPEPLFIGETVFCCASGPSFTLEVAEKLRGRRVAVVNSSYINAPWADLIYFTDSGWFENGRDPKRCGNANGTDDVWPRRTLIESWPGVVVTMSKSAKRVLPDKVKRVKGEGDPSLPVVSFPPFGSSVVRQGRSSGHTIISVLIATAAPRIILVGYDMRVVDGREHCHSEYIGPRDLAQYDRDFVPAFAGWNEAAKKAGVEILNATPGSALTEFPFVDLDEVLCAQS